MASAVLTLLGLLAALPPRWLPAGFTEAPAFVALFTPRAVPAGTYRTYTTEDDLDAALAALRAAPPAGVKLTGFAPQSLVAGDAFGSSGGYNRWKLALLYGARRARVARGALAADAAVVEAWTLVSPYPDPRLERLNPGTLLIVLDLEP